MWRPVPTSETREDVAQDPSGTSLPRLWARVAVYGSMVAVGGWVIAKAGFGVIGATGVNSGVLGFTLTTIITSLPELVTLLTAVRVGALTLGVSTVIGGNAFDALQISLADVSYSAGTIYAAAGPSSLVLLGGTILITAVMTAGLIMRERRGVGFEGAAVPLIYVATVAIAMVAS
jgi:cation:H+ antiporter